MTTPDEPGPGWDGTAYAAAADHHRRRDAWFLDTLPPRPGQSVVDLGCGSGDFTAVLADLVAPGPVVGVDPDPSMLEAAARHARDNLEFRLATGQRLDAVCEHESADLVVSRAVLHWIPRSDLPAVFVAVRNVLRPGGWLHAESGGAGNCQAVVDLAAEVATRHDVEFAGLSFLDAGAALEMIEDAGLEPPEGGVTTIAQRRPFTDAEVAGLLETQAVHAYSIPSPAVRDAFVADLLEHRDALRRHDGTFDQTFVRLHLLARRPV